MCMPGYGKRHKAREMTKISDKFSVSFLFSEILCGGGGGWKLSKENPFSYLYTFENLMEEKRNYNVQKPVKMREKGRFFYLRRILNFPLSLGGDLK